MAENLANYTNTTDAQRAFDTFIGFIYAVLIALVIKTAYYESEEFNSIVPVTFTLILLIFFAYDWMSRFYGRSMMSEKMTKETAYKFVLKLLLEIAIVYFLLLFSLKLVDRYATLDRYSFLSFFENTLCKPLCLSMAAFVFLSGVWNALMIAIFTEVDFRHVSQLAFGHLDDHIVDMFPKMKSWKVKIRSKNKNIKKKVDIGSKNRKAKASSGTDRWLEVYLKVIVEIWSLFTCFVINPIHLLLPYLFVVHVVALNFILGILITLFTLFGNGNSLSTILQLHFGFSLSIWFLLVGVPVGVLLSLLFLVLHHKSEKDVTHRERIGCYILYVTIIYGYSLCSVFVLIALVVVQQVIANLIMNNYFEPPSKEPEKFSPPIQIMENEELCNCGYRPEPLNSTSHYGK